MVRASFFAIAAFASVLPSMARIQGFNITTKPVAPGDTIDISFHELNYITQEVEYYAALGINSQYPNTLGSYFTKGIDLQKASHKTTAKAPTKYVTYKYKLSKEDFPTEAVKGLSSANFTAVIFGAVGASGGATSRFFTTTINLKK